MPRYRSITVTALAFEFVVPTVRGSHFIQEDSPDEIGQAIAEWRAGL